MKLSTRDLNPDPYSSHPISIYTYGVLCFILMEYALGFH